MTTLCYGEFDFPDGNAKLAFMRNRFLRAIEAFASEVCEDLYKKAFVPYTQFKATYPDLDWFSAELGGDVPGRKPSHSTPADASINRYLTAEIFADFDLAKLEVAPDSKVGLLYHELKAWAATWHLKEVWIFNCAMNTLEQWSYCADHAPEQWAIYLERPNERLHFAGMSWGGLHRPAVPPPPTGLPDYEPLAVTRTSYLFQVRTIAEDAVSGPIFKLAAMLRPEVFADAVVQAVKPYCVEVERCYEENGLVRCRNNEKRNLFYHLKWAVEFQVKGKTFTEIAETAGREGEGGVEPSTVSRGVLDVLRLVALKRRSNAKPGRRLGSKNKPRL